MSHEELTKPSVILLTFASISAIVQLICNEEFLMSENARSTIKGASASHSSSFRPGAGRLPASLRQTASGEFELMWIENYNTALIKYWVHSHLFLADNDNSAWAINELNALSGQPADDLIAAMKLPRPLPKLNVQRAQGIVGTNGSIGRLRPEVGELARDAGENVVAAWAGGWWRCAMM